MNKTILIVDDTPDLLQNLSDYLSMEGFRVIACLNPEAAILNLDRGVVPDLIITDLAMPRIDGLQFIAQVRTIDAFKHIPIVIFSAKPLHETQVTTSALEVSKYIKKPCPPDEILLYINQIFQQQ
ncbi:response regulator [Chryseosolibacter indicus]|uniref:Response regulator n=1 Tax=Chryseosolibacter indicus TaxID=2782351 RepID=A0ABS5VT03_9BACT|nr:response regulator [Chryseosolibacter indicus]MBT1703942.1 response regulator [Chryseosolibacter indicus]